MQSQVETISLVQLIISYFMLFVAFFVNYTEKLKLTKDIIYSFIRMSVQLLLIGYILKFIFQINNAFVILIYYAIMVLFAANIVKERTKVKFAHANIIIFGAIFIAGFVVTLFMSFVSIGLKNPFEARYFIPLAGMIVGNSMNSTTIAIERFFSEIHQNKQYIEELLSLGATAREATIEFKQRAFRSSLMPQLASVSAMGIVSLPGMMTGQILSGVNPIEAVKYQMIILIAINTAICLSVYILLSFEQKKFFNSFTQLNI
ncbi:MAG: ABC transporter permease [Desulfurella sp.]|uniref:ABC transporter permease n=1 Tax=Desulfurella sp. TaxID=1962857 RepID=UPI003D0B5B73